MLGSDIYHQFAKQQVIDGFVYDQYGYAWENCTSYCAIETGFAMGQKVPLLGTADNWPKNAIAQKIPTDNRPRIGDYACFGPNRNGAGPKGHVAIVTGVGAGWINLSEYNFEHPLAFGTRTQVPIAGLLFVHYYKAPVPTPVPTPTPTGVSYMWLYQLTNETIYLVQGGVKLQLSTGADAEVYILQGVKLYKQAQFTTAYQATLAKIPVIA